jgi:hypothetical protein
MTVDRLRRPIPFDWGAASAVGIHHRRERAHCITTRETGPHTLTPESVARALAEMTRLRVLRVAIPPQLCREVADKFELFTLGCFLQKNRRLVGGGSSHLQTILHPRFPVIQGKYREFSRLRSFSARIHRPNHSQSLPFLIEFPTRSTREKSRRNRERIRRNREFSFGISERLHRRLWRSNAIAVHLRRSVSSHPTRFREPYRAPSTSMIRPHDHPDGDFAPYRARTPRYADPCGTMGSCVNCLISAACTIRSCGCNFW